MDILEAHPHRVDSGKPLRGHWPAVGVVIRKAKCLALLYKQGFWLTVKALFQRGALASVKRNTNLV